jgi:SAM-dependent methyltransferase
VRYNIKAFIKFIAETLPIPEPIYEFGSYQVPGQIKKANLRDFFPGKKYIGADMREGPGVDICLNLHGINLPDESAGTVLILDTLEHVEYPRTAIKEAFRILKPNGILVISSQMYFPVHDYPNDYWRFTPQAFESLLNLFSYKFVHSVSDPHFPHTVVGVAFKREYDQQIVSEFEKKYKISRPLNNLIVDLIIKFLPPGIWGFIRDVRFFLKTK